MRALILSAGLGTRLRPLTYFVPKPMVKVAGKPVLEHIADYLNKYGINEIYVNLHYKPLSIMKHFRDRFLYFYENELSGETGAIKKLIKICPSVVNEYLVVMNGDTLTDLNISEMYRLSRGISAQSVDKGIYTGIKILSPDYLKDRDKLIWDYSDGCYWVDCGTFDGLKKARKHYEKLNKVSAV